VQQASRSARLYYVRDAVAYAELPPNLVSQKAPDAPTWLQEVLQKWPALEVNGVSDRVNALMAIQSTEEMLAVRSAAKATVKAIVAGLRAIRPSVSQRNVEAAIESACWTAGAHGSSFRPWAMAGENAVFPRPFFSNLRYDHLNRIMRSGDLVRLDVGCEWDHYQGDLGRTVPVSGVYDDSQRETWNIFVAAYHAGVSALHEGARVDQVFDAWQSYLGTAHQQGRCWRRTQLIPGQTERMCLSGKCIRPTCLRLFPSDHCGQEPRLTSSRSLTSTVRDFSLRTCLSSPRTGLSC